MYYEPGWVYGCALMRVSLCDFVGRDVCHTYREMFMFLSFIVRGQNNRVKGRNFSFGLRVVSWPNFLPGVYGMFAFAHCALCIIHEYPRATELQTGQLGCVQGTGTKKESIYNREIF